MDVVGDSPRILVPYQATMGEQRRIEPVGYLSHTSADVAQSLYLPCVLPSSAVLPLRALKNVDLPAM